MMPVPSIQLSTGATIPAIGFGAAPREFSTEGKKAAQNWVHTALQVSSDHIRFLLSSRILQVGYRHVDTAQLYGTEYSVGAGIRASGVLREEVFVTTKLPWHHAEYVARSFDESLKNLGLDYVDLYLMHFPQTIEYTVPGADPYSTPTTVQSLLCDIKAVDNPDIHASGRARAIGVSNFSVKTLEKLFETAKIVPAVNQVECHPWLVQTELLEYCRKKGIVFVAYSPTGRDPVRSDPTILALAEKYSVSPAQVILAWHVARGTVAVPSSTDVARQKENINLPTLSTEDLTILTALDRNERVVNNIKSDGMLYQWTAEQYGWD
ncbi:NADP-dependent oxidoreductase domain-containing protein [Mycena rebaudengoi]|nr:NADP-dependent oxidoreductase domain-containing protein [Mycena rebaudengoi]